MPAAGATDTPAMEPLRVLHFVSGGFSGATQVAIELVSAACRAGSSVKPLLVLRRKRKTDPARVMALQATIPVETVPGWAHAATVSSLVAVCQRFQPDVLVAHGFSEHLLGRYAGLLAKVPVLIHVEHNSRERYTPWRLAQARWLARRTTQIVGCSEGVRKRLLELGFPADITTAIPNGIRLEPFEGAEQHPFAERVPGIVMSARFSGQKDHATLLKAIALLAEKGMKPPVLLAGGGKASARRRAERLTAQLGIAGQVRFLGFCDHVPRLLMTHQIAVLSTHYEGMPLALVEAMAAGCAVVGSDVVGVSELIEDGDNGRLVPESDPAALAEVLHQLLRDPITAAGLAARGRAAALSKHSREIMTARYESLFMDLAETSKRSS
jgi:glycosyltransferase involved in cell wall biosynthesis